MSKKRKKKEVQMLFLNFFGTVKTDNKPTKLEEFKKLLTNAGKDKLKKLYDQQWKELEKVTTHIPERKSFLHCFGLRGISATMLNDIAEYAEFLKLLIEHFEAYNECIELIYLPRDATKKDNTKKQRRPIINNDQRTMRELDTPLHCAVRQLNEGFIEWLLEQPETEVNLRNKRRETALAILCQMYDCVSKLKTRLEDIEKEREKADEKQQINLDGEKIEVSTQMKELEEELTMNAPTILKLIKRLLEKGADFNVYMNDGALPFDFLWKHYKTDVYVAHLINLYAKSNVVMTEKQQKSDSKDKSKVNDKSEGTPKLERKDKLEGKDKSKKRVVKFYKKTEDMVVIVTVELLEIFMCFNDFENFTRYWNNFQVTSHNVKKVITLLLNVAVKQNNTNCVEHIMKKASKEIFLKLEENKTPDSKNNQVDRSVRTPMGARLCCFKCCKKRHNPDSHMQSEAIEFEDHEPASWNNRAVTSERTPMGDESVTRWRCFKMFQKKQKPSPPNSSLVKEEKLAHHAELKGLLKTVCENGNNALLKLFLFKINDKRLLNEHPLLILTIQKMSKVKEIKEIKYFQDCSTTLIENHGKIRMQVTDPNKNTALHLALSYGYENLAMLMLKHGHGLMGLRNRQNLIPIDYGTTQFWNNYLDSCITIKDKTELRLNVGFLRPLAQKESTYVKPSKASKVSKSHLKCLKSVAEMNETHNSKYRSTRTVNDMTALRLISQSTDRKDFLMHPVIIAFITMKWKRLLHWHILNLLLTTITMGTFIAYTLMPCPSEEWNYGVMAGVGACIIFLREIMQLVLLRWSYVTVENVVDIMNVLFIGIVLGCGCERGGMCEYVSSFSSFLFVSLALQATFLLGATWNNLSITLYMFKTVSSSFFYSFLSFTPVIVAFICSFYRMYNEPSGTSISNGNKSKSSEENFNNFHSAWDATIKTLVMTTGDAVAANIVFDDGRWLLFVTFLFIASIVILNLINGLAVSDIADIRKESEFISVYRKVRMLERYERAVIESRCIMPECLQWLFRDPLLPFFENYESFIYVMVNKNNKLAIKSKMKDKSTKEAIPSFPWLPSICLKRYIGIRSFQLVLYMSLDQSYVDKAKTIAGSHSRNNSGRGTNELADTEQTERLTLTNKTAMNQCKMSTLSSPSVPDSRDAQIEMLQGQVRSMIATLNDIQQQLAEIHARKADSTAITSRDHSRGQ